MRSRHTIGDIELTLLTEAFIFLPGDSVFHPATHQEWAARLSAEMDGSVKAAIKSLLVRTPTDLILVDTGYADRPTHERITTVRDELADMGIEPHQISTVILTHAHDDHCLGNTELRAGTWEPAFPRAQYLVQRREADAARASSRAVWRERFEPLERRSQLQLVDGPYVVDSSVELVPTPGHTVGHQVVRFSNGNQIAVYLGDLALFAASLEKPHWGPEWAWSHHDDRTSRRDLVQWAERMDATLIPGHDPTEEYVKVHQSAQGYTAQSV
jgi:glyoxylase-like metal-dependent hydrolase (beta-lactamase superfamily II)